MRSARVQWGWWNLVVAYDAAGKAGRVKGEAMNFRRDRVSHGVCAS
jgi:hypothetical protein